MLSAHRRHTKPKRPSDSSITSTDAVRLLDKEHNSKTSGSGDGFFSYYFARARRRLLTKSHRETDTLLPTTYATSASPSHHRPSAAAITCNSFLMGGHYYPGKDKKRRHMRRRTLWYKIFCSSPWRKITSFLTLAYILVWHVALPLGDKIWQVGLTLSSGAGGGLRKSIFESSNWLQYDASLKMPDLTLEQKVSVELAAARARLQYGSPQQSAQRLSLLESIVPAWYHRNDPPSAGKEKKLEPAVPKEPPKPRKKKRSIAGEPPKVVSEKDNQASKPDAKKVPDEKKQEAEKEKPDKTTHDTMPKTEAEPAPKKAADAPAAKQEEPKTIVDKVAPDSGSTTRLLKTSGEGMTARTIHTPSDEATALSKCHALETDEYATTIVTQSSLSRLWILNETCARWKDPIIAVVFVPHGEEETATQLSSLSCPNLQIIQYMASPDESSDPANYPVNRLRNVGLDAVTTTHVMVMDVDFVPSMGLAETIRKALKLQHEHNGEGEDQQALVVPAFERLPPNPCESETDCALYLQRNSSFIPSSFEALQGCLQAKDCIVFQSNNNWDGHSTTQSERWIQRQWYEDEETKSKFMSIPCFHTARYEPYLVVRWCPSSSTDSKAPLAPYYDERFHGYGKNKIELVSHLRKKGYQFAILPEGFIVHNPHPESSIKEVWNDRKGSDLHSSMDKLYAKFLEELEGMYKEAHENSVKLCKREQ